MRQANIRTGFYCVELIRSLLHHLSPFWQVGCVVVGAAARVTYRMGKLVFDVIGAKAKHFVESGSRHSPEAVAAQFVLAGPHTPHGGKDGVVTHGLVVHHLPLMLPRLSPATNELCWPVLDCKRR